MACYPRKAFGKQVSMAVMKRGLVEGCHEHKRMRSRYLSPTFQDRMKNMKTILILAHPGHELRIFHWMEQVRPVVCVLTDGSGGNQSSRTAYSIETVAAARAFLGPVFGQMPDRDWYDAILAVNVEPILRALRMQY